MQNASNELKEILSRPRNYPGLLKVTFGVVDINVVPDAAINATQQEIYSDVLNVFTGRKIVNDYHTLENNSLILGYGGEAIPSDSNQYKITGMTSSVISDSNGLFSQNPSIEIITNSLHSILGLTFKFDAFRNNWCNFTVVTYNNNTVVDSYSVEVDSPDYIFNQTLDNWNRMVVTFTKTSIPQRRLRLTSFQFGIYRIDQTFISAMHSVEYSPFTDKLPQCTFQWTLSNITKEFRPGQESGVQKYLMEQQPVTFEWGYPVGDDIEWVLGGNYLTTGKVVFTHDQVALTAKDLLSYMTDIYNKGIYQAAGASLYDLAEQVLTNANLPLNAEGEPRWKLWEGLRNLYSVCPLPRYEGRLLLQLIVNCGGCVFIPDRNGDIIIQPKNETQLEHTADYHYQTSFPDIIENPPLADVVVNVGTYTLAAESEIYKSDHTINGTQVIEPEYPESTNWNVTVTGNVTNFTYECYASYAKISITGTGDVHISITANKLERNNWIYTKNYSDSGEVLPFDNVLCTNAMTAELIARNVGDFYIKRTIHSASYMGDILLDPLDRIWLQDDFNQSISGMIILNTINYNGAWSGNIKWSN